MIPLKLLGFVKEHKKLVFSFFIGSLFFFIYLYLYKRAESVINPGVRSLGYFSCFLILTSLFLFFVKLKQIVLANIVLTINLIVITEIVCFFLLGRPGSVKKDFRLSPVPDDHISKNVGNVPYSDSVYNAILIKKNDTVYNVKYSIDNFNKRITPGHDSTKNKHSLFFGCSISFGEGLNDDQTLAYYFQKQSDQFNSYNYGLSGQGANNMLARLQYQNLPKQVVEKDGVAFYIFFWDHMYRSIGTMARYCNWAYAEPYYKIENDKLVRNRLFKDGRPFISTIYELIYQTNIVKYFKLDFPLKVNDSHIALVCEIVKESKKEYQKQFGNNNFYCVMYPNYVYYTPEEFDKVKACLTKKGVDYIDLSEYITYAPKHTLGKDAHPNAGTNELLAKELMDRYLKHSK